MTEATCMNCGELIADTSAPDRFCSQACFNTLLEKVKADWDQRYRKARAGIGVKPLAEIVEALTPSAPKQQIVRRV